MYYNHHQQARNMHALRMQIQGGGNGSGDSGLVLSTDAKPRLKWTTDLHERFIEAVNQLGGADSESIITTIMHKNFSIFKLIIFLFNPPAF